jgi:hypothetical protein
MMACLLTYESSTVMRAITIETDKGQSAPLDLFEWVIGKT